MFKKTFLFLVFSSIFSYSSVNAVESSTLKEDLVLKEIDQMISNKSSKDFSIVPIEDFWFLVKTSQGSAMISGNRRAMFFNGSFFDLLEKKQLTPSDNLFNLATVLMPKSNLDINKMTTLTYGTGRQVLTIFIDPLCPYCHMVLSQLKHHKEEFTYKIVLIPTLGQNSADLSEKIMCFKDKKYVLDNLLDKNLENLKKLPTCSPEELEIYEVKMKTTQKAALHLSLSTVPLTVLPNAKLIKGIFNFSEILNK